MKLDQIAFAIFLEESKDSHGTSEEEAGGHLAGASSDNGGLGCGSGSGDVALGGSGNGSLGLAVSVLGNGNGSGGDSSCNKVSV